ncbi:Hsp70 family protein [Lentilitoribacter sp. EG35]|uniref:Hsp70 family protein n=1 Tax=Lentilitoribacter sp. EG35 TaxID=3234192 RepID=UPI00345FF0F9
MTNKSTPVLGIDFGTSNSAVGYVKSGSPYLINIEGDETTLPTAIFFDVRAQEWCIGRAANQSLIRGDEGRYMRALKSILGTSLLHERRWLGGKLVTYADIISNFLQQIKTRAETQAEQRFDHALSGRPVFFHSASETKNAKALKDLTQCYINAGFKSVEFMYEPEAAAIANGGIDKNELALIVDIGGGTSDYCLFKSADIGIDVLACNGVRVGGTNFDRSLSIDHVMPLLGHREMIRREWGNDTLRAPNHIFQDLATWSKIPSLYAEKPRELAADLHKLALNKEPFTRLITVLEEEIGHDIAFAVEDGKIETNNNGQSDIDLAFIEAQLSAQLTSEKLGKSLEEHAKNISDAALETLQLSDYTADQVDKVIFVGGSSHMKIIEQNIAPHFKGADLLYSNAFTAIIDGLAIASGR